ncbi:MAG: hypothetical protein IKN35_06565 [Lachnospiraceae bacterium]|nr:hypothetical protein [Lachnospiraceae bacterium]
MKKNTLRIIIIAIAAILLIGLIVFIKSRLSRTAEDPDAGLINDNQSYVEAFIGETPISEYYILNKGAGTANAELLQGYIRKLTGHLLNISSQEQEGFKSIKLEIVKDTEEKFSDLTIDGGYIILRAKNSADMKKQVSFFANAYLGYEFASSEREKIIAKSGEALYLPQSEIDTAGNDWIERREPIICLWKTTSPRGCLYNPNTNLSSELMSYSDEDLYTYVKMMKRLGYNGIQVTDMCSAWAAYGSYEYVHDRLRFMADAAHSMGMNFTLWVWGAEFNGYGWNDKDVDYYDNWKYGHAYENPKSVAAYEKYYDIYAQLADCSDRMIMHFDDPGNLVSSEDIAYFSKIMREKARAVNPDIDFGISCYTKKQDPWSLDPLMEGDTTYYIGIRHTEEDGWGDFRSYLRDNGMTYGVWSWNLTEMEIDQLAEMNVNSKIIKKAYTLTSEEDHISKPSYWSEMDSYHVLNVFSHYVAASLLRDPSLNEQWLLRESAKAVVTEEYADELYEVLSLIEDARSGSSWEEFKWGYEEYILTSKNYPAEDINKRAKEAIKYLDEMIAADIEGGTLPLPVSTTELLEMIRPHILQIESFSKFRADLNELESNADGLSKEELQAKVEKIYTPVPEFDVIVGLWGQTESRAQFELLSEFCKRNELEVPRDPAFTKLRKDRLFSEYEVFQKLSDEPACRGKDTGFQFGLAYGKEETEYLTGLLIEEGLLSETEDGKVYITDYKNY